MGTHPIFESDFDCLTGKSSDDLRNWKMSRIYSSKPEFWAAMKNHVEEMRFEKFKQMVNKEEQFYLRQHSFAIKKYEKSAEECKIQREARARMERRKTLISLNPPLSQPDFNRRMTKLTILDPDSLKRLRELENERIQRKELVRKRWRKVLTIAKFNLSHKRIRQQQLTLKLSGNRPVRFEERVLEQSMNTEAPPTDVQKFHRRFTRQSIAGRTSDFDQLLKNLKQKFNRFAVNLSQIYDLGGGEKKTRGA